MRDKWLVVAMLSAVAATAQTCPDAPRVRIEKTKTRTALPAVHDNKALLVVVRQQDYMFPLTPIAVDGTWVGANAHWTYFYSEVDPGSHVLCTGTKMGNSKFKPAGARLIAEAGKTYYFESALSWDSGTMPLLPIDDVHARTQ